MVLRVAVLRAAAAMDCPDGSCLSLTESEPRPRAQVRAPLVMARQCACTGIWPSGYNAFSWRIPLDTSAQSAMVSPLGQGEGCLCA